MTGELLWSLKLPVADKGVNADIDSKLLELDGVLPPAAEEGIEKKLKKLKAANK